MIEGERAIEGERERGRVREFPKPKALPDEGARLGKHPHYSPWQQAKVKKTTRNQMTHLP